MVTLYDRDARAVAEILKIVARYHSEMQSEQDQALHALADWRPKNLEDAQASLFKNLPKAAVAARLSSIATEIADQLNEEPAPSASDPPKFLGQA